ncbi:quercetin dioxygenase-like cupin family protein [Actinocorallia herbida]|uniref:Quercetin dioxygenase-like cupin family protein n=1 Tax=Actinocorallia herbida TaxID=58109 RepID=A0A3N1CVU0_9ACTN|nr:cupin domain-containing protein [Actinocorallia herbida]ROO85386.1 quercetin dioxygenase-like cupin family protein [Actinocorallia herbida]
MSYPDALYLADKGEVSAVLRAATAAPDLSMFGMTDVHYLATGASTGGQYGLYRWEMSDGAPGPAAHFHKTISEAFYVLDGTVGIYDGETWHDAAPGEFVFVPPGGIHAFRNAQGPATMLILFAPGAPREAYFEDLADIITNGTELTPDEWTAFYNRHDQYML